MRILIVGGAGYIGSHMVKYAQDLDHEVTVLDDFSTGNKWAVRDCEVIEVDLLDRQGLLGQLSKKDFDGVFHFAAKSLVGESMDNPFKYYINNISGTLNLLDFIITSGIQDFVFSSTAAIFGSPNKKKIDEKHLKNPLNTYGRSKLMIENILEDVCAKHSINATALRYFNAAGSHPEYNIGEYRVPETHLIPNVLTSIKSNEPIYIFGDNYETHDGTCIRDYVHVMDLAEAHMLALLDEKNKGFSAYNLGNGTGFSVKEIIMSCEMISGQPAKVHISDSRPGDPSVLVADSSLAKKILGWNPKYTTIDEIIKTAWDWHKNPLPTE